MRPIMHSENFLVSQSLFFRSLLARLFQTLRILSGQHAISFTLSRNHSTKEILDTVTGVGYSLSVSGNDGRHPNVVSKVTVEFLVFTNTTIENSVTLQVSKLSAKDLLSQNYRALLDVLQEEIDVGDNLKIFSLGENASDLNIHLAVESPQGKTRITPSSINVPRIVHTLTVPPSCIVLHPLTFSGRIPYQVRGDRIAEPQS